MTPHLTRLRALGLTAQRFAELTGEHPVTIRYWGRERPDRRRPNAEPVPVPQWVWLLIEAWETHPELIPTPEDHYSRSHPH